MLNKIYAKNYINNSIAETLHRYGHCYDSIESDIDIKLNIDNNEKILLLNNLNFDFIDSISINFKNDFDNKINFDILPIEINDLICSYLIDKRSFKFNLFELDAYYKLIYKINVYKHIIILNIKFKLRDKYFEKLNKFLDISDYVDILPNYLFKQDIGFKINSKINRDINIVILYKNYNKESFYSYKDKYLHALKI